MCDCYQHKCESIKCDEHIPVHIRDFETSRGNLIVYCHRHIPQPFEGTIEKITSCKTDSNDLPRGFKVGFLLKDTEGLSFDTATINTAQETEILQKQEMDIKVREATNGHKS